MTTTATEIPRLAGEILSLPEADRLALLDLLWDEVSPDTQAVSPDERAMIEARLAEADANPHAVRPWTEVRAELFTDP
jgi:putative addiction module component (TIGR02574 family)